MTIAIDPHPIYDRKIDSARQYWSRVVSAGYGGAIIPIDHSRAAQRPAESLLTLTISGVTFERLIKLTAGSSFLLYVTLLTAVKVCLYKYSRRNVITVGGPSRSVEGESPEPSHALAIVDEIDGKMSFRTLLLNIKETVIEAYQYQDYPLWNFIDDLEIGGEDRFRPQVLLTVKEFHGDFPTLGSDITLEFEKREAEARGIVSFDPLLFNPELIRRFADDIQNVLSLALQDTTASINHLSALTPAERQQLLLEWNNTDRPFPKDQCAHELFVSQTRNTPEAVAVVYEDQHLSYSELNRRANRLARYLNTLGVGPEGRVALCLERSLEMVMGVLGALKAGGAYVPLDPAYPPGRLAYILEDARAEVLLTQRRFLERLPLTDARVICLDQEWERISDESESEPESGVVAENLAYMIYTSGSTGRPKGVMVAHKGIGNLAEAFKEAFGIGDQSRVLQFASLSFDASVPEIFSALTAGGSLRVSAQESLMPGDDLVRVLNEDRITTVTLPPSVLAVLDPEDLLSLQTVVAAGEACGAEIVERWARGRKFIDAYGPTEATVCASFGECEAGSHRKPAIGWPIANTRLYILDREMEPTPVEVRGQLYISGVGLARGYWGRPDLTAERFIPNPFSREGGERLYRTGDVSRYLSNGSVDFIGRDDEQIKMRGYRIELGEIEAVLDEHPSVRQSVVVASEDERGGKRLLGYVVGEEVADAAELKRHVREKLPGYMVPETILVLEEMPVTPNGKIDRKKLSLAPMVKDAASRPEQGYLAPRTPVEEILAGLFGEALKLNRVGIRDNFFQIGGHSLLATQVVSRVKNAFGVEIGIKSVFEDATIEGLGRRIEEAISRGERLETPPLVRVSREGLLPLSFSQQRMWFLEQLAMGTTAFYLPLGVRLKGSLNEAALEQTFGEIIRRHENLRTTFPAVDSQPVQIIHPPARFNLPVVDLCGLPAEERERQAARLAQEETMRKFDLAKGPLVRLMLLRMAPQDHIVICTMHHIVGDGQSFEVVIAEMSGLYAAAIEGRPSPLAELPLQYADYSAWQRQWLRGEVLETRLAYWRKQLADAPQRLDLPQRRARPRVQAFKGAKHEIRLPAANTEALRELSQREGVTLFMTMLSGFALLLNQYAGAEDIVVGTVSANRERAEAEKLIGILANTLVLRVDVSGDVTFRDVMRRVREVCLDAYTYQTPPEIIREDLTSRGMEGEKLFDVWFQMERAAREKLEMKGLECELYLEGKADTKFELSLILMETDDELIGYLEYDDNIFTANTTAQMLEDYFSLLEMMVANPEENLSAVSLISDEEIEQLGSSLEPISFEYTD